MDKNGVKKKLATMGVGIPEILLPRSGVEYTKFSVIACDQFTADRGYWDEIAEVVGKSPSALHMILPEAYLSATKDLAKKIDEINAQMERYLKDDVLKSEGECFVYLHRTTTTGVRHGLLVTLDLDQYDYTGKVDALICATEKTVVERLPSRIQIRKNAPLEMPHAMVLIDDRKNLLIGELEKEIQGKTPLYDFDLMAGGGHSTAWKIDSEAELTAVAEQFSILQSESETDMLFAVGDGNHSLAAAKECWEEIKNTPAYGGLSESEKKAHPARFVLVELVNMHDPAMMMEPVHRVLFDVDREKLVRELDIDLDALPPLQDLQPRLDEWLSKNPQVGLDYIHGAEAARELGKKGRNLALVWDKFDKDTLFQTVRENGALVRKSFSMGEARDKRYYLECRRIKKRV